jgi:rhodanese-related sulfurtransferase
MCNHEYYPRSVTVFATQEQVQQLAQQGRLIDVRTAAEFKSVRVPEAVNLPLDAFNLQAPRLAALSGPIAIVCHSGKRAAQAHAVLLSCDKNDVLLVEGGTEGWRARGGPVEHGVPTMSLERQVRIAAGGIAALGGALALGIHSLFALVPLMVGSGLVIAGLTDTCMLGMLLAKMPWNRQRDLDAESIVSQLEVACSPLA